MAGWVVRWTDGNGTTIDFGNQQAEPFARLGDADNMACQLSWFRGWADTIPYNRSMKLRPYRLARKPKKVLDGRSRQKAG